MHAELGITSAQRTLFRRIYGTWALLLGMLVYGVYVAAQIDRFDGSVARTLASAVAGIPVAALIGCSLALAPAAVIIAFRGRAPGAGGLIRSSLVATAVLGIVVAFAVVVDHH